MCTGKRFLAVEEAFGSVSACDCGTVHLTLGSVSLALNASTLRRLQSMVNAAVKQLPPAPAGEAEFAGAIAENSRIN